MFDKKTAKAIEDKEVLKVAPKGQFLSVSCYDEEPQKDVNYIYAQIKGFDAVSIGPDIKDVHTVNERLSISSAARVYEYLLKLLAELK